MAKNKYSCDIAVIGAGISGMIAAVRAAQGGKRVRVFEKGTEDRYVCNSRLTSGVFACCQMDIRSDANKLEEAIIAATGGHARPDLARMVATDSIRAVRWMQSVGIRFIKGPYDYQAFLLSPPTITPQGRQWEGRGGDVMLRTFEAELKKHGGELIRGHSAKRLLTQNRRVCGLSGECAGGDAFEVVADAVVIADGGFQSNTSLLRGSISPAPEKVFQRNSKTGLGDGISMAKDVGAKHSDLRGFYGHVLSKDAFNTDKLWPYAMLDFVLAAGMVVTSAGKRFEDEGLGGVYVANAIAALADPSDAIVISDQKIWDERGTYFLLPANPWLPKGGGTMYKANTLGELATLAGIEITAFLAEVDGYNNAIRSKTLSSLTPHRSSHKFQPYAIEKAPFYAFPACAGITYTTGGILIDAASRALDEQDRPIAGLYAVGCSTGGLEGGENRAYVGGLVKSAVTGLRAAEHILGELKI